MTTPSSAERPARAVRAPTRPSIWQAFRRARPALLILALALPGCAHGTPKASVDTDPRQLAARIAQLDQAIADDRAQLEQIVSVPRVETDPPLHDDRALRAIGKRLSDQVEERDRLRRALRRLDAQPVDPRDADSGPTDRGSSDLAP